MHDIVFVLCMCVPTQILGTTSMLLRCERQEVAQRLSQLLGKSMSIVWAMETEGRDDVTTYLRNHNTQRQFRVAVSVFGMRCKHTQ